MKLQLFSALVGAIAITFVSFEPATAQNYYDGKTVTVISGYDPGGGADTIARLFTKHWEKHLPGVSSMIVKNQTGAGGASALNFIYEGAKPDGLTVIYQPWNPVGYLTKAPGARADYTEMPLIGGGAVAKIAYASTKTIKSSSDFLEKKIKLAGSHPTANLDLISRSALDALGVDYIYVTGFNSTAISSVAIEQGEVDLDTASGPGFARRVQTAMIPNGSAFAPWYYPKVLPDGTVQPIAYLEEQGIPNFYDVYVELRGEEPSGPNWEAFKYLQVLTGNMLFAAFAPPGTPDEAIKALQDSFTATTMDEDYLTEAARFGEISFATVEEGLGVIDSMRNVDPEILKAVNDLINTGQ